jgi:N-acetylmuramic acid 6-phosphate (MurNAc-6-P) etherase
MSTIQLNVTKDQAINVICRQTTYTREEAAEKLEQENNNLEKVIEKFMNIEKKEAAPRLTGSQERYRLIRRELDKTITQ